MLLQVAYCRNCTDRVTSRRRFVNGEIVEPTTKPVPMYGHNAQGRSRKGSNYRCQKCGYSIRKEVLERAVEIFLMDVIGDKPLPRMIYVPAVSHTAELGTLDAKIADIEALAETGEMPARSAARMLAHLEAKRDELAALPQREAAMRFEPTDQTVREHWATLDVEGRGRFLRNWGVQILADRQGCDVRSGWEDPDNEGQNMAAAFGLAT